MNIHMNCSSNNTKHKIYSDRPMSKNNPKAQNQSLNEYFCTVIIMTDKSLERNIFDDISAKR